MHPSMTRRDFMTVTAIGAALMTTGALSAAQPAPAGHRIKTLAFSKVFQNLSYDHAADLVAEVGWDGIECPVRAKGQVLPERVEEDLPRLVDALAKRQREITIITTDVREVTPLNEKVLRTAAKLGIRKYRLAHWNYPKNRPILDQLKEIQAKYRDLVALNKELGIQAGYQNHSGSDYVGAPIWDIHSILKEHDPNYLAMHFDIGHATLEGGQCWPIQARLMQPYFGAVYIKDFFWEPTSTGFRSRWCPLGQGMVRKSFIDELKRSSFAGPISQHHEYFESATAPEAMVRAYKQDLQTLRSWLTSA